MKKCIATFLLTICCLTVSAQKGLNIHEFFKSHGYYGMGTTEVWVEGEELKPYRLSLYRSISVKDNASVIARMEQMVRQDFYNSSDKEVGYLDRRLYYAFVKLKPLKGKSTQRYLFYRNSSLKPDGKDGATLVYMEGKNMSLDELKKIFKK